MKTTKTAAKTVTFEQTVASFKFRDELEIPRVKMSVELCQGDWTVFTTIDGDDCLGVKRFADRAAALAHAVETLRAWRIAA